MPIINLQDTATSTPDLGTPPVLTLGGQTPDEPVKAKKKIKVQKGDSLSQIADANDVALPDLLAANRGVDSVFSGMTLNLPRQMQPPSVDVPGTFGEPTSLKPFGDLLQTGEEFLGHPLFRRPGEPHATDPETGRAIRPTVPFQGAGIDIPDFEMEEARRITAEGRNLAGSRFNVEPSFSFDDPLVSDGIQRQGVLNLIDNMFEGKFMQRVSSLVVPTMFSEMSAIEKQYDLPKGQLLNDLSGIYEIDALGNLVQKGTAEPPPPDAGFYSSGYGYSGRGGGGGSRYTGAGGNISTNMTTWRIATG